MNLNFLNLVWLLLRLNTIVLPKSQGMRANQIYLIPIVWLPWEYVPFLFVLMIWELWNGVFISGLGVALAMSLFFF